jgi:hypothetical protein
MDLFRGKRCYKMMTISRGGFGGQTFQGHTATCFDGPQGEGAGKTRANLAQGISSMAFYCKFTPL